MSAADVRDELLRRYCGPEDSKSLLGSVHTILKRLERSGKISYHGTKAEWVGWFAGDTGNRFCSRRGWSKEAISSLDGEPP